MKIRNLLTIHTFAMIIVGCNPKSGATDRLELPDDIIVRYRDSSCTVALDTVLMNRSDTTSVKQLHGYYRIASQDGSFFSVGQLINGKKTGVWKSYSFWHAIPQQTLNTIASYRNGKLNGTYFTFTREGEMIEAFFYVDDKQVGKQKEYDIESRKPVLIYETNKDEQFINEYLAVSGKGDTLYHTNFGKDATGYKKRYDRGGVLLSEGIMIKGKQEAFTSYEYDYYRERYISASHYTVTDTSETLQWTKIYPEK